MNATAPLYRGYRFPPGIISHAVWLYHRFCLSFRDAQRFLSAHGLILNLFRLGRHLLRPATHRLRRSRAFMAWSEATCA
jgi:hypothetical protein